MKHFNEKEMAEYIQGSVKPQIADLMEEHFLHCSLCLEKFTRAAQAFHFPQVPTSFTDEVMESVAVQHVFWKRQTVLRSSNPKKQMLVNYAVAACLTVLLTFGGAFGILAKSVPHLAGFQEHVGESAKETFSTGWSAQLAEKAVSIIDVFIPD